MILRCKGGSITRYQADTINLSKGVLSRGPYHRRAVVDGHGHAHQVGADPINGYRADPTSLSTGDLSKEAYHPEAVVHWHGHAHQVGAGEALGGGDELPVVDDVVVREAHGFGEACRRQG